MRKAPSQEAIDALIAKTQYLEKMEPFELTEEEKKGNIKHFNNNFNMLFEAMKEIAIHPESKNPFINIYLKRAESLGEPWKNFLSQNTSLLKEIDEILEKEKIISEVRKMYRDILFSLGEEESDKFERKFHPEIGSNTFVVPHQRKLNALLQKAAKAMEEVGIDPQQFHG